MQGIVHICGAPGAGKTTLAARLSAALHLPIAAVDDERRKLLEPGCSWPRDDSQTWSAMAQILDDHPALIVETVGGNANSRALLRGRRVLTVLCKARPLDRYHRLRKKSMGRDPLVGDPAKYLASVTRIPDPQVNADVVWDRNGDFDALLAVARSFLGETDGRTRTSAETNSKAPQQARPR